DKKGDKHFVPTLIEKSTNATSDEVATAYKAYCENNQTEFPSELLSKTFTDKLAQEALRYNYKFNYSLSCIEKIKKHFLSYRSEFEKDFCSKVSEGICSDYKEKTKSSLTEFTLLTEGYKNRV